ncbi:MAG: hypothetical protein NZM25_01645, partial [Leptospiraceae bacterium]|nr:hypothetical protein [Leptospiraceae bacterium]
ESIAQVKAIHLGGGYDFVNYQHAGSDFGIFTRFTDEPQARVFLAQESKTGEILPLFGEPSQDNLLKLWFGNSLNIPERFLDQGLITQMQNCLKEKLPAFLKNEIVLVFQPKDYGFFFEASEKVKMFYTMKKGLEIKVD